jgi:RimJ/RimL family protein N-acetyltransferase
LRTKVKIRYGAPSDAEQIILHTKSVLKENPFVMGTALEEFSVSVEDERRRINNHSEKELLLVAEVEGKIIGLLNFKRSFHKKFSHNGSFSMSIQESYTNQGIGSSLIRQLLQWAKEGQVVEKIYLEVFANNERAIHLYKKLGFIEEGRKKNHVKNGPGQYEDEIIMSQFV